MPGEATRTELVDGIFRMGNARICDRAGERHLPIGDDGFETAVGRSVFVDKTMLIADVLNSGKATLFCRPRRFGKTLALTMLKTFFETTMGNRDTASLFEGLAIWEAHGGAYRRHQGAYPVIYMSFNDVEKLTWNEARDTIKQKIAMEYRRHAYLADSNALTKEEKASFSRISTATESAGELATSLFSLVLYLQKHHGQRTVILIDEYDAPVLAGHTHGYYDQVVAFLKGWLTGALKDGGAALAFACLTGVQRITKESIFSDLNDLLVNTPLSFQSDERFGFTGAEVRALATYLERPDCLDELQEWYDGYHFGNKDIYNPWSVLNYFYNGCKPDVYWLNTSSNTAIGDAMRLADERTTGDFYRLLEPDGTVVHPLDLDIVFPDISVRQDAIWSMLYLAGYLTTEDTSSPNDPWKRRPLRIPNKEIARLFSKEVMVYR